MVLVAQAPAQAATQGPASQRGEAGTENGGTASGAVFGVEDWIYYRCDPATASCTMQPAAPLHTRVFDLPLIYSTIAVD